VSRRRINLTLLEAYEKVLKRRVDKKIIVQSTLNTALNDANRILESLLATSSVDEIKQKMRLWGYTGDYSRVINDLLEIANSRKP